MQASDPTFARSLGTLSLLLLAASCGDGAIGDTAEGTTPDSQTSDAGTNARVMSPVDWQCRERPTRRRGVAPARRSQPLAETMRQLRNSADIVEPPHPDAGAANNSSSSSSLETLQRREPVEHSHRGSSAQLASDSDALIADFADELTAVALPLDQHRQLQHPRLPSRLEHAHGHDAGHDHRR